MSDNPAHSETRGQPSAQLPVLNASDLQALFKRYPSLRLQLQQIYQSTQEPSEVPNTGRSEHNSRAFTSQTWKPEKGFQSGMRSLQSALNRDGSDAQGINAFMNLLSDKPESGT